VNTSAVLIKMSILKFFKLQSKTSHDFPKELPDPNGPLSKTVPPSVIKMANDEERAVCLQYTESHGTRSIPNRWS